MDIVAVRTFLAASVTGSFLAASKRVHASASTVTERIKQLEHDLGARLFVRDKRGCTLTPAGRRFVEPAQAMVRAWDNGRARVALPPRFRHTVRIGGQHALWPTLLVPWLEDYRRDNPELAIFASAAAPGQLNRALEEDELDIAFLYEPVLRKGMRSERLAADRLILVTAAPKRHWRENFVRLNWSEAASLELGAVVGELPAAGLELELGVLSLDWLIASSSSGFVPERLAQKLIEQGALSIVRGMPKIEFSPFACWRSSMDDGLARSMIRTARRRMHRSEDLQLSLEEDAGS